MKTFLKFVITVWILMLAITTVPWFLSITNLTQPGTDFIKNTETKLLKNFMKDERVQIIFESENMSKSFGIIIKNGAVVDTVIGEINDPTITIRCNSSVENRIINSKDKISAIVDALLNNQIIEVKSDDPLLLAMFKTTKLLRKVIDFIPPSKF